MIDLHLHTTASDGTCSPAELVGRAWNAGIRVMAVTDHDTMNAVPEASEAAAAAGMRLIPGIEVTAVSRGADVHVLAYGLREETDEIGAMLALQRERRAARAREICLRLDGLGAPLDVDALIARAAERPGKALARPHIAAALVAAGHVTSIADAFERFLGDERPAYVPHQGATPEEVVDVIVQSGGIASFAHPGIENRDDIIPRLVEAGMSCIEVFTSRHDLPTVHRYLALCRKLGLYATGGSDYHGEGTRHADLLGVSTLPAEEFRCLERHLEARQAVCY